MKKTVWILILISIVLGIGQLYLRPCGAQEPPPLKEEDLNDDSIFSKEGSLNQDMLLGPERAMYIYGECINPRGDWELNCIEDHRLVRDQCRLQCKDRCCLIECERQHELFCCERCLGGVWSPLPLPNCKQPFKEERLP